VRTVIRKILALAIAATILVVEGCGAANDAGQLDQRGSPGETTKASTVAKIGTPEGVESVDVGPPNQHTEGDVVYEQTPPAGGKHDYIWQNCGFYSKPVRNENAVHSLEHGAVWITYRPGLPAEQMNKLRELASSNTYVLVSPFPDLPSPVVASAWGKQLRLDSATDPRLKQFVSVFRQGPQAPEPEAPCTDGKSATTAEP
jgi:uncharacterized protein DUF3105